MEDILKNESKEPEESPRGTPEIERAGGYTGNRRASGSSRDAGSYRESEDEVVHHPRLLGI